MRFVGLLVATLLLLPSLARAEPGDEALAAIGSSNFDETRRGVEQLAVSGNPRAADIIGALQAGSLFVRGDHRLFIKGTDGALREADTGQPAADVAPSMLKPVRVNNNIRRSIEAALGSLQLFSPDPSIRLEAAEAVFKSRNPATLPALDRAIGTERQADVKRVMAQARAAAILSAPVATEADRLAAIAVVAARGDLDARSLLASLANQPKSIADAAAAAVSAIDVSLRLWNLAQSVFYGLSLGSVLLLAAAGLAITFGVMGVINMAHGEMVMIGAYVTFLVQQMIRSTIPGLSEASLIVAVPLAFPVTALLGIAIERGLIRFLYGRPLETLLATFGISLLLQQTVRSIFGPTNREVATPSWMSGATQLGQLTITHNRMVIMIFSVLVVAALMATLRGTSLGLRMRAVTQNRQMASAMGINTPWIDAMTFGLGSGVAGMAGVALSQIDNVSPNLGQSYIVDSFMVVVFGGVGNLWGTVVGAFTLGIVNKFLEPVAGAVLGKVVVLLLLILFIQRRPRGMFPLKGRAAEA
ncbi:MAG: urea ABC transporter permease subunit UrtB [Acetobacteraceae bacterium]|nr:urea ABC transporter permease subunit UrtB [Acetobacteraceae bacterium]